MECVTKAWVPKEDWPYQLPDNWCWVYLLDGYAECLDKYRKPVNSSERAERIGDIPYYGATGQVGFIDDYLTDEQLVLLGEDGAPFLDLFKDKAYIIEGKAWVNNHAHILRSYYGSTGNKFLFHYLNQFNYKGYVNGTTRLKLTQASMANIPIVFPPIPEQHRIVARIESLFAKLDEAKEKIKTVLEGAEKRKAAILHKAFTGQLTANWRKENGVRDDSWEVKKFEDVAEIKSNLVNPQFFQEFPHIAPDNIKKNTGELLEYHTVAEDNIKSGKHRFYSGQILYSKIRPYLSKVVIVDFDGLCSADMYPIEARKGICIRYLWYYMLSDTFLNQATTAGSRTVLPKINQRELNEIKIDVPSLPEQHEIVRLLDNFLAKEKSIVATCEKSLATIEQMKKSILAKAFRGELGTNDPGEGSALSQ